MSKKKPQDHLGYDVMQAEALGYGCHYGNYKADHPETQADFEAFSSNGKAKAGSEKNMRACAHCGQKFQIRPLQTNKLYCSDECRIKHGTQVAEKRRKQKVGTVAVCPICGIKFRVDNTSKVYCSRKCSAAGNRKKSNERAKRCKGEKEEAEKNGSN